MLNTYDGNYDEKYIPPIRDGAYKLIKELSKDYKIIIFTSGNSLITSKWIIENRLDKYIEDITNIKVPAYLIIDDRCINFNGDYEDLKNKIKNYKVWKS